MITRIDRPNQKIAPERFRVLVIDSGIGGLTFVKHLNGSFAKKAVDFVYIGDNKNAPYGVKSANDIQSLGSSMIRYGSNKLGCNYVVVACHTISSHLHLIKNMFEREGIEVRDIVGEGADAAADASKTNMIGLFATQSTIDSGLYERILSQLNQNSMVFGVACPEWVSRVESGDINSKMTEEDVAHRINYLHKSQANKIFRLVNKYMFAPKNQTEIIRNITREVRQQLYEKFLSDLLENIEYRIEKEGDIYFGGQSLLSAIRKKYPEFRAKFKENLDNKISGYSERESNGNLLRMAVVMLIKKDLGGSVIKYLKDRHGINRSREIYGYFEKMRGMINDLCNWDLGTPIYDDIHRSAFLSSSTEKVIKKHQNMFRIDTAILGCTHFRYLAKHIRSKMGGKVSLIDPAVYASQSIYMTLNNFARIRPGVPGAEFYFTKELSGRTYRAAKKFLGTGIDFSPKTIKIKAESWEKIRSDWRKWREYYPE